MKRFHILVSGRVQGVFFRTNTVEVARKLRIKGWIRNLKDGRVEIVAEGGKENLDKLVEWLKDGPVLAKVVDLVIEEEKPTGEFDNFERKETA